MKPTRSQQPVAIIGGGVIGLAAGWQLLRRGAPVTIFERDTAGRGASWAAAGMLAPHSEVGFEAEAFLRLGLESLRLYPRFLDELEEDASERIGLDDRGTLIVAFDRDDTERIRRLYEWRRHLDLPVSWLSGEEARDIEPLLSPRVVSAISLPDDSQVNNRRLVDALKRAFVGRGGVLHEDTAVVSIENSAAGVHGVRTANDVHGAGTVVVAAGCWSRDIGGIPEEMRPPVRPVKGQIVALRMDAETQLAHVVRAPDVYLCPKDDGRLLVGATQEEMGFDLTPTAGPVMRLLERAWEAVPSIYDLPVDGIDVGLRPGSRDHEPIVGATRVANLFYATGHHRHGILLAPITAVALSDLIIDGEVRASVAPFAPSRFAEPRRSHHG